MKNIPKLRFLLFILSIFIVTFSQMPAQKQGQALIDSLLKELPKSKEDTNKVNLLVDLSFTLNTINPDKGIKYGQQGLKLAEKLNWKKGIASSLIILGNCYNVKSNYNKAIDCYLKSSKLNEEIGDKILSASNLTNIGTIYTYQSNYPKALKYFLKSLKIHKELNHKRGIAINLENIGIVYAGQTNYSKALEYKFRALKIYEELGNKSGIANILMNMGNNYCEQSDYPNALKYFFKSLKMAEELGKKSGIAWNLVNIGNVYNYQSDYTKALEYYFKSLKIHKEMSNKRGIASTLVNIGVVYHHQSDYPKAMEYYFRALKSFEGLGIRSGIAFNLKNIGVVCMEQSDYHKALEYFFKSLKIYEEVGEKSGIEWNLAYIGNVYGYQEDLSKALEYELKALKIAEEIGDKGLNLLHILNSIGCYYKAKSDYINALDYFKKALKVSNEVDANHLKSDVLGELGSLYYTMATDTTRSNKLNNVKKNFYLRMAVENLEECVIIHREISMKHSEMNFIYTLYNSYKELGNYKKAYENYQRYNAIKDSIFSFEKSKEIANIQANYKVEKKEKENKILNLEIEKQTNFRNYLIVFSILILLLAIVTYNRFLHKRKANKILDEKILLQQEAHKKESQIMTLKNELLETELDMKQKELTAKALNLVDKNEYMSKIKEHIEEIANSKPEEIAQMTRYVIRSINMKIRSEDSWEGFERQFKAIHRGFMENLASQFPELTVMELKVCALLKINLSSKEIASLLSLSTRTVEDHRLNIRKKMGLDKDVNLNLFMAQYNVKEFQPMDMNGSIIF